MFPVALFAPLSMFTILALLAPLALLLPWLCRIDSHSSWLSWLNRLSWMGLMKDKQENKRCKGSFRWNSLKSFKMTHCNTSIWLTRIQLTAIRNKNRVNTSFHHFSHPSIFPSIPPSIPPLSSAWLPTVHTAGVMFVCFCSFFYYYYY